jgi:hypothetical protein
MVTLRYSNTNFKFSEHSLIGTTPIELWGISSVQKFVISGKPNKLFTVVSYSCKKKHVYFKDTEW